MEVLKVYFESIKDIVLVYVDQSSEHLFLNPIFLVINLNLIFIFNFQRILVYPALLKSNYEKGNDKFEFNEIKSDIEQLLESMNFGCLM